MCLPSNDTAAVHLKVMIKWNNTCIDFQIKNIGYE